MKRIEKRYFLNGNNRTLIAITVYNESNTVVEETLMDEKGNINSDHRYQFNEQGKLIKELVKDDFNDDALPIEYIYENDRLIEKRKFYNDGSYDKNTFEYNGNKITHIEIDSEGEFTSKRITVLDANKNVVELREFYSDDEEFALTKNSYNEKQLLVQSFYENKGENINTSQDFIYDDKGRLIESKEMDLNNNKLLSLGKWFYENDRLVKEVHQNTESQPNYFEKVYTTSEDDKEQQITISDGAGTIFMDILHVFNEKKHLIAERVVRSIGTSEYGSYQSPISEFEIEIEYLN